VGMASHDSSLRFIVPDSLVGAAGNIVAHETPSRTCIARDLLLVVGLLDLLPNRGQGPSNAPVVESGPAE